MIAPITSRSNFPLVPTISGTDAPYTAKYSDYKDLYGVSKGSRLEKEIDPTTLFVGGLEMFGPGAWNEEKVKAFFSRFGGLECVKVVRPSKSLTPLAYLYLMIILQ